MIVAVHAAEVLEQKALPDRVLVIEDDASKSMVLFARILFYSCFSCRGRMRQKVGLSRLAYIVEAYQMRCGLDRGRCSLVNDRLVGGGSTATGAGALYDIDSFL